MESIQNGGLYALNTLIEEVTANRLTIRQDGVDVLLVDEEGRKTYAEGWDAERTVELLRRAPNLANCFYMPPDTYDLVIKVGDVVKGHLSATDAEGLMDALSNYGSLLLSKIDRAGCTYVCGLHIEVEDRRGAQTGE